MTRIHIHLYFLYNEHVYVTLDIICCVVVFVKKNSIKAVDISIIIL